MKFSSTDRIEGYSIQSYAPGRVVVNGVAYQQSLIVRPERIAPWGPESVPALTTGDFEELARMGPEIVLLGTGQRQRFPTPALFRCLIDAGIGLEVMDTGAACRTYNILAAEGRSVAAALLMIEP